MSEPQPAGSVNRAAPEVRAKLGRGAGSRAARIRGARQRQQLQLVQTNPSGGGAQAPLPWQPSRAGDGKRAQPGETVGGSVAHRCESCARGPGAEAGHTAKPRPKGDGRRPLTAAVFWRQCVPPPANPKRRLPALSGLNCPPAGRRRMGGLQMGEGARGGHVEPEGSGVNSHQHGSSRRGRRSSNMASGARGQLNRAGLAQGRQILSRVSAPEG